MRTLRDLVNSGKIHYVGLSNVTGWQFQKIVDKAKEMGLLSIVSIQVGGCDWRCGHDSVLLYRPNIIYCVDLLSGNCWRCVREKG